MKSFLLILFSLISIASYACCTPARAQQIVYPDSVVLLQEPTTGAVGFVLPRQAGAHYRQLFFEYVPALEKQLGRYETLVPALEQLAENRRRQLDTLRVLLDNRGEALARCDHDQAALQAFLGDVNEARKHERRQKRRWRTASLFLAGTTAVLAVLAAGG